MITYAAFFFLLFSNGVSDFVSKFHGKKLSEVKEGLIANGVKSIWLESNSDIEDLLELSVEVLQLNGEKQILILKTQKQDFVIAGVPNSQGKTDFHFFPNIRDGNPIRIITRNLCEAEAIEIQTIVSAGTGYELISGKVFFQDAGKRIIWFEYPFSLYSSGKKEISISLERITCSLKIPASLTMTYKLELNDMGINLKSRPIFIDHITNGEHIEFDKFGLNPTEDIDSNSRSVLSDSYVTELLGWDE